MLILLSLRGKKIILNQILLSKLWYRGQIYTIPKYIKKEIEKNKNTISSGTAKKYDLPTLGVVRYFRHRHKIGLKIKWIVIKFHQCSLERSHAILISVNSEFSSSEVSIFLVSCRFGYIYWRNNTHGFVKKPKNVKIRVYLMQNVMELDMKKISDAKALTFGIWGLKTSLGRFGPKDFPKGFIKPLVEKSSFNFHKQDLILSRIIRIIMN